MRALNTACITYKEQYAGYPRTLANLGPSDAPSSDSANLLDATLATGQRNGYVFAYVPVERDGDRVIRYAVTAGPISPNSTGTRHFFVDQSGVIRQEEKGPASANSPPLE